MEKNLNYRLAEAKIHLLPEKYDVSKHWSRTRYEDEDVMYMTGRIELSEVQVIEEYIQMMLKTKD